MKRTINLVLASGLAFPAGFLFGQGAATPPQNTGPAPIYHVTVIQRTVKAINYRYRSDPTQIDFHGTVLRPEAKGDAWVQSKQGSTVIDATIDHLTTPQRYGREYLTYVLWAITPEGGARNLGELVTNGSGKAKLHATTGLQAFALIVTAEPYSTVHEPSDVVVAENLVRPDTVGKVETIDAKYELLPRGQYTLNLSNSPDAAVANAPKVSSSEADMLTELYQAENALNIARAAGAEQYATSTLAKADQLYEAAQRLHKTKGDKRTVIEDAREASQTAEDARAIAQQRQQEQKLNALTAQANQAQAQIAAANQAKSQAEAEAQQARAEAQAAEARAKAEQAAVSQTQTADPAPAPAPAPAAVAAPVGASDANAPRVQPPPPLPSAADRAASVRSRLIGELNGAFSTRDTPRGLVVTVPAAGFTGSALRTNVSSGLGRVAAILLRYPALQVRIEGYSDNASSSGLSAERAQAVSDALLGRGLKPVSAQGLGNARPLAANTTAQGRAQNNRVEIVISGDAIGRIPTWERNAGE